MATLSEPERHWVQDFLAKTGGHGATIDSSLARALNDEGLRSGAAPLPPLTTASAPDAPAAPDVAILPPTQTPVAVPAGEPEVRSRKSGRGAASTPIKPDKYTYKDDAVARKRGIELRKKWEAEEKNKPSIYEDRDGDGVVDQLIDDAAERAKAFAAHGLSEAAKGFEADTPELEFLVDLKKGVDHVSDVLSHVDKALKYWQQHGKWIGIGQQVADLANISSALKKNLGKVSTTIDKAGQALAFAQGLDELSASWSKFDPANPATHEAFIKSVKKFGKTAEPFVDWAKVSLVEYAIDGSAMAAKGLIVIQMVTFYAQAGLGLLEAGMKAQKLYIDRLKKITRDIETGRYGMKEPEPQLPPPPVGPGAWSSRREDHNAAVAYDNASLLAAIERNREAQIAKLESEFQTTGFPQMYLKERAKLIDYIWKLGLEHPAHANTNDSATPKGVGNTRLAEYWAGLLAQNSGFYAYDKGRFKRSPSKDEVANEIGHFRRAAPPCPLFAEMFKEARDRYVTTELGRAQPAGK